MILIIDGDKQAQISESAVLLALIAHLTPEHQAGIWMAALRFHEQLQAAAERAGDSAQAMPSVTISRIARPTNGHQGGVTGS